MAEPGNFSMEPLRNMMQAMVDELKQDNVKLTENLDEL